MLGQRADDVENDANVCARPRLARPRECFTKVNASQSATARHRPKNGAARYRRSRAPATCLTRRGEVLRVASSVRASTRRVRSASAPRRAHRGPCNSSRSKCLRRVAWRGHSLLRHQRLLAALMPAPATYRRRRRVPQVRRSTSPTSPRYQRCRASARPALQSTRIPRGTATS